MRSDHQPIDKTPKRPARTPEERREVCGTTLAFVLATETGTTPLVMAPSESSDDAPSAPLARPLQWCGGMPCVRRVVDSALDACMAGVYVLAAPELYDEVVVALAGDDGPESQLREGAGSLTVLAIDRDALATAARNFAYFELFDLPIGILLAAREIAASFPDVRRALFIPADCICFTPDHIFELCEDMDAHEGTEAIASWISWFRRPPYLVDLDFLGTLKTSGIAAPASFARDGKGRPVPQLAIRDHCFGEEKLAPNAVAPEAAERFFDGLTMTALQAVELAKWAEENPGEEPVSPNQPASLLGPITPKPLSEADRLLFECACEIRERIRSSWPSDEADALEEAACFGARNRRDFPLLNDRGHAEKLAFLDSAASSQRLAAAVQAQNDFDLHENANIYRGSYELSAKATFTYNDARKRIEDFIGAERRETVFTVNTSTAIALVAQAWGEAHIEEGDTIVTTIAEHHSTMLPFRLLAERKGARVIHIPVLSDGRIDLEAYGRALDENPKLVALAHVGNVLGIEAPVQRMAEEAHRVGARFLIDTAQSFPHMKLDVRELGADWVAFSGHKAYGPTGIGVLWISPKAFEEMDPVVAGGGTVSHVSTESYYLRPKTIQYELGTPPISQAIGLAAAVDYLDGLGMDAVHAHAATLTRYAACALGGIEGLSVLGDHSAPDGQNGLVSFTLAGVNPSALASFLGKLDVAIRAGSHCAIPLQASMGVLGAGRLSMGVYTIPEEIEAACTAIEACRRIYWGEI